MQNYWRAVVFYFLPLSILLCIFFSCSDAPRVRLVKDNDYTFHFQWDKPLKEERIILVRCNEEIEILTGAQNGLESEKELRESDYLVHFSAGSFISAPIEAEADRFSIALSLAFGQQGSKTISSINTVEIRPAHLRNTIRVPARLYAIDPKNPEGRFVVHGDRVILREHPSFREYRVDEPSRLTFVWNTGENSE